MSAPKTLLLTETGVAQSADGSSSVNVGPIVRALKFLTEGRGDDRGTDEAGNPLPDLMSLAFDVVESIILGGRKADYFRQVKLDLEAMDDGVGRSSLGLAKHATRLTPATPVAAPDSGVRPDNAVAPDNATGALQGLLEQLLAAANALGPKAKATRRRAAVKKRSKVAAKPNVSAKPVRAKPARAKPTRKKAVQKKPKRRR